MVSYSLNECHLLNLTLHPDLQKLTRYRTFCCCICDISLIHVHYSSLQILWTQASSSSSQDLDLWPHPVTKYCVNMKLVAFQCTRPCELNLWPLNWKTRKDVDICMHYIWYNFGPYPITQPWDIVNKSI